MDPDSKPIVVLDANAFISMANLTQLGTTHRLITTADVLSELKDPKTKSFLKDFPFEVENLECEEVSLQAVKELARKTGDLSSLSDIDVELLALTHTLYTRLHPEIVLRSDLKPMTEIIDSESEEEEQVPQESKREEQTVQVTKEEVPAEDGPTNADGEDDGWIVVPVGKKAEEQASESEESDEDGWVTPANYNEKMAASKGIIKKSLEAEESKSSISLMTADFAMQNVAVHMGMRLLALDGRVISNLRRFVHECYLCWKQFKIEDSKIRLCSNCGYNSLSKIAYSLTEQGQMILHRKKGWKPNTNMLNWKERKLEEQENKKKHQHSRRRKKPSIFETC